MKAIFHTEIGNLRAFQFFSVGKIFIEQVFCPDHFRHKLFVFFKLNKSFVAYLFKQNNGIVITFIPNFAIDILK